MKRQPPTEPSAKKTHRGWQRIASVALRVVGLASLFCIASLVGLALHLNLPAARRALERFSERVLEDTIEGNVEFGAIKRVALNRIRIERVTLRDPGGAPVLELANVVVELLPFEMLAILLDRSTTPGPWRIPSLRVRSATLALHSDPSSGEITLIRALRLRPKAPGVAPPQPSTPSTPSEFSLPNIEVGHVVFSGSVVGVPPFAGELRDVRAALSSVGPNLTLDVDRVGVQLSGIGPGKLAGTATLSVRPTGALWSHFDGFYGDVQGSTFVHFDGEALHLRATVPKVRPDDARALVPEWPLRADAALSIEAKGKLPTLEVDGSVDVATSEVKMKGTLELLGKHSRADLDVRGRGIDLSVVLPKAPRTNLEVRTKLTLQSRNGVPVAALDGGVEPSLLGDVELPRATFSASLEGSKWNANGVLHEPGVPLDVEVTHEHGTTTVNVKSRRFRLEGVPRLKAFVSARGSAELDGHAVLSSGSVRVNWNVRLSDAESFGASVETATVTGSSAGTDFDPAHWQLGTNLSGKGLRTSGLTASEFQARIQGSLARLDLRAEWSDGAGRNLKAEAEWARGIEHVLSKVALEVQHQKKALSARAARIAWSPRRELVVDGLTVAGDAGSLTASLTLRPKLIVVAAHGTGLDAQELSALLGLRTATRGKLDVDAEVTLAPDIEQGRVHLALRDWTGGPIEGVSLGLAARLEHGALSGESSGQIAGLGNVGAVFETRLAGSALEPKSWFNMTGRAEIQFNEVELTALSYLLPDERVTILGGKGYGRLELHRRIPALFPSLVVHEAGTYGLKLLVGDPALEPVEVSGIEAKVSGSANGENGSVLANVQLEDAQGTLLTASATSEIALADLILAPERILPTLAKHPFMAVLSLPERKLSQLPALVRPEGLDGRLHARVQLAGSPVSPLFSLSADLKAVEGQETPFTTPVDVRANAVYRAETGEFGARAELAAAGTRTLLVSGQGTSPWQTWFDAQPGIAWTGRAHMKIEGFALGSLKALAEHAFEGDIRGNAALENRAGKPELYAEAELSQMRIEGTALGGGKLRLRSRGGDVSAELRASHEEGNLHAQMRCKATWSGSVPSLAPNEPIALSLKLQAFDAVALTPLTRDVFSEVRGPLNGDLKAELRRHEDPDGEAKWSGPIRGHLSLTQGRLVLAKVGLELEDVRFSATARTGETGTDLEIADFQARADSDSPNVLGYAKIYLDELEFDGADARIRLGLAEAGKPVPSPVPLPFEGIPQARVRGSITAELRRREQWMDVLLTVPSLTADLSEDADRALIGLKEDPDVVILQPLVLGQTPKEGSVLPWKVHVTLGDDVELRRTGLRLSVRGRPDFVLGDSVVASGTIMVRRGGIIDLQGKPFVVERGDVRFENGDPKNPAVHVLATWRAPDTTTYNLEVQGTLLDLAPRLSTDPPSTSETAAWAKLLGFGGSDAATGVGIGIGADLLGKAFAKTPVALRAGRRTASSGRVPAGGAGAQEPTYLSAGLSYRVSEKLSLEGSVEKRETTPLSSSEPDSGVTGTMDYRISPNWSLRTDVGTVGAGLDLLWQYRY